MRIRIDKAVLCWRKPDLSVTDRWQRMGRIIAVPLGTFTPELPLSGGACDFDPEAGRTRDEHLAYVVAHALNDGFVELDIATALSRIEGVSALKLIEKANEIRSVWEQHDDT